MSGLPANFRTLPYILQDESLPFDQEPERCDGRLCRKRKWESDGYRVWFLTTGHFVGEVHPRQYEINPEAFFRCYGRDRLPDKLIICDPARCSECLEAELELPAYRTVPQRKPPRYVEEMVPEFRLNETPEPGPDVLVIMRKVMIWIESP